MINLKYFISIIAVPITAKRNKIMTYFEGLLAIKSHDPLMTWTYKTP